MFITVCDIRNITGITECNKSRADYYILYDTNMDMIAGVLGEFWLP